jgi:cytochrome P450
MLFSAGCPGFHAGDLHSPARSAYFDEMSNLWVLSQYRDVLAAFHCPFLVPVGPRSKKNITNSDDSVRQKMRAETRSALSPRELRLWNARLNSNALALLDGFHPNNSIDLVNDYARPLCCMLACDVTGIKVSEAQELMSRAGQVSAAAAEPFDHMLALEAKAADAQLSQFFHTGPQPLRESGFVAISQTLCFLLASTWLALIQHPTEWSRLHDEPSLIGRAIEEMLRYTGFTRILFRMATEDVKLNDVCLNRGDRLVLKLPAAHRDATQFTEPDRLVLDRPVATHFALGNGSHSCIGAPLLRMAAVTLTGLLVNRYPGLVLSRPVVWKGGSGFLSPAALLVVPTI